MNAARAIIALVTVTLAVLATAAADPVSAQTPSAQGLWRYSDPANGKPKAEIRVVERHGELLGTVEKIYPPPGAPAQPNCDKCSGDLKGKPMLGMTIMRGMHFEDAAWRGGTIVDAESGDSYRCIAKALPDGKHLELRGYIGVALFGRTSTWTRVND
jgi:uncharacterized protein (DUF2147 family)